jgi:energy-coupling factor transporter ATP-binding protein EcfA2
MAYLDLEIQCINDDTNSVKQLSRAVDNHEIVILLGSPGSGKSTLLKKYSEENPEKSLFQKIIYFLRTTVELEEIKDVLLLDGLDEYRCTSNQEKTSVIIDLAEKIKKYSIPKVVISCREMDWYGETDLEPLKSFVSGELGVYRILPLDHKQKFELAEKLNVNDSETFIKKYDSLGFLENPQLFKMLTDLHKEGLNKQINSKKDLFLDFINYAREQNPYYLKNKVNKIELGSFIKCAGYIAFFYMLSNIDNIESCVSDISSTEHGFSNKNLEVTLQSAIFKSRQDFMHRTLAEFLAANFIYEFKIKDSANIALKRIKSLFVQPNGRVPTSLRGTYAWLCSLSGKDELIEVDPYYQAIHADNATFPTEFKARIIQKVREYSKIHPYFYEFSHQMSLEGFYTKDLEDFLLKELDEAIKVRNHYFYFLANLLVTSYKEQIGQKIVDRFMACIDEAEIPSYYKRYMIKILNNDKNYLATVLNKIKNGKIDDDSDDIKEEILTNLYPDFLKPDDITDYLFLYKNSIIGHCLFLFDTPDTEKFKLVDNIFKASYVSESKSKLILPENTKRFIKDYFLEICLKYEEELNAKNIYEILKHFKQYYKSYSPLEMESYSYKLTDKLEKSEEKLAKLANELFAFYLEDYLNNKSKRFSLLDFNCFFSLKPPENYRDIILSRIRDDLSEEQQKELLNYVLIYSDRDRLENDTRIRAFAEKIGLINELEARIKPVKQQWQIEQEQREKKHKKKQQKKRAANEKYFAKKTDEEIIQSFNALDFIAWHFYLNDVPHQEIMVSEKTFERLKYILKQSVFNPVSKELLTIESLAENSPNARRKIDQVYYTASILNEYRDLKTLKPELLEYFYIIHLQHTRICNVNRNNFVVDFENDNHKMAEQIICKYLKLLFDKCFADQKELFVRYLEKEAGLEELKEIASLLDEKELKNELLEAFCKELNFKIKLDDLKVIDLLDANEKSKEIPSALLAYYRPEEYEFSVNSAIALHKIFHHKLKKFKAFPSDIKTRLLNLMMDKFNTAKALETSDGFQTARDSCASFLNYEVWPLVTEKELRELIELRQEKNDLWSQRLINNLYKINQEVADTEFRIHNLRHLKDFILRDTIISNEDFFAEVCFRVNELKDNIETNRDNQKQRFYNSDKPLTENDCTDVIALLLKNSCSNDFVVNKENDEADNRVDLNLKYQLNSKFEVQVECKKDSHRDIYTAIEEQLIDKYLCKQVQFGIYLVYYFGNKKDKEKMFKRIQESVPVKFKDKVKIICIDLTNPNKSGPA